MASSESAVECLSNLIKLCPSRKSKKKCYHAIRIEERAVSRTRSIGYVPRSQTAHGAKRA